MGGGVRVGEASALIDSDVNQDCARAHCLDVVVGNQLWCLRARNQNRTND